MRYVLLGSCLSLLSCMSSNPEPRISAHPQGTWTMLKTETFDGQGNLKGTSLGTERDCKSYLKVSQMEMEFLDPGTAIGEAASEFSRCYSRLKTPYHQIGDGVFKRGVDSVLLENEKLVFIRRLASFSGREELETSKVYYGKIGESEMDFSKCGCFQ